MFVDWGSGAERPVDKVMNYVLDAAYNSNRAPVALPVHLYFLTDRRIRGAQKFVKYALSKPDVYFVTNRQLVDWMKAPVPISQMAAWLKSRCKA